MFLLIYTFSVKMYPTRQKFYCNHFCFKASQDVVYLSYFHLRAITIENREGGRFLICQGFGKKLFYMGFQKKHVWYHGVWGSLE